MSVRDLKIVFGWNLKQDLKDYFSKALSDVAAPIYASDYETEKVLHLAEDADILVSGAVTDELLTAARQLKLLVIPYIGVDRQIPILRRFPDLAVVNSKGNVEPTAQHAVGLMLAVSNRLVQFDRRMRDGLWRAVDDSPASFLLEDVTIGILGTGGIGQAVMRKLSGFSATILGCSRSGHTLPEFPDVKIYPAAELEHFLRRSKVLIIGIPKTDETEGLIGEDQLQSLPDQAILVNVSRGSVVTEEPLFNALKSGRLMGAGLDVWYDYRSAPVNGKKYPYTLPFHELDNVVLSPHRGGSPLVRTERFRDIVTNIRRFISGQDLLNRVDVLRGY